MCLNRSVAQTEQCSRPKARQQQRKSLHQRMGDTGGGWNWGRQTNSPISWIWQSWTSKYWVKNRIHGVLFTACYCRIYKYLPVVFNINFLYNVFFSLPGSQTLATRQVRQRTRSTNLDIFPITAKGRSTNFSVLFSLRFLYIDIFHENPVICHG